MPALRLVEWRNTGPTHVPSHHLQAEDLADLDHFITVTTELDDPRVRSRTPHSLKATLFVYVSTATASARSMHADGHYAEGFWD